MTRVALPLMVLAIAAFPGLALAEEGSPWQKGAAIAVRKAVDDNVTVGIREITHPTEKNGDIKSLSADPDGTGLLVRISVHWNGRFLGTDYVTVVQWRFTESDHVSATVVSENSPTRVSDQAKMGLDDYLRETLFAELKTLVSGSHLADPATAFQSFQADVTALLAKPLRQVMVQECDKLLDRCKGLADKIAEHIKGHEAQAAGDDAKGVRLKAILEQMPNGEEEGRIEAAIKELQDEAKALRQEVQRWQGLTGQLAKRREELQLRRKAQAALEGA